jgi:hypothetical protein
METKIRRSFLKSTFGKMTLTLLFIFSSCSLYAQIENEGSTGLRGVSKHEIEHIERNWPKVIDVKPNKLGAERINKHLEKNGYQTVELSIAKSHKDEIILHNDRLESVQSSLTTALLPSSVNNATRMSFPPIGNQRNIGSCVGWASTYYQASHELGLLNGYNNKESFEHVLSPKWTYNLLNDGMDQGLVILDAYQLLSQNGAVSLKSFPYDANYLAWDLNEQDWIDAISNRLSPPQVVSGIGGESQNLTLIKQLLNNGHVLTMGTFVNSWVFKRIKPEPSSPRSLHQNEYAVSWMNGQNGGHCITIVGYDDNLWIDINENGQVDEGERGAFLLANSWGPEWGNQGLIWVAYDAFLSKSAVKGGPSLNRLPVAVAMDNKVVSVVPKESNYSPKLIAKYSLKQNKRNEVSIAAGVSLNNRKTPSMIFKSAALSFLGGNYNFEGTISKTPETAVFALDLTDLLLNHNLQSTQRYYLLVGDNKAANETILNSFSLLDPVHNRHIDYPSSMIVDNGQIAPYIDYNFVANAVPDKTPPVVTINAPLHEAIVKGNIQVAITAKDTVGIDRVEIYIDNQLKFTDKFAPYSATVNTRMLSNGDHTITAIAYDISGNTANHSVTIRVAN